MPPCDGESRSCSARSTRARRNASPNDRRTPIVAVGGVSCRACLVDRRSEGDAQPTRLLDSHRLAAAPPLVESETRLAAQRYAIGQDEAEPRRECHRRADVLRPFFFVAMHQSGGRADLRTDPRRRKLGAKADGGGGELQRPVVARVAPVLQPVDGTGGVRHAELRTQPAA